MRRRQDGFTVYRANERWRDAAGWSPIIGRTSLILHALFSTAERPARCFPLSHRLFVKDNVFKSIIRNASWLLSSNIVGALFGLLALTCAGHGMSNAAFGTLVVVQAYAKVVSDVAKFQTWQMVVRFGAPALAKGDLQRFCNVTNFSFGLDLMSGGIATVAGMLLLPWLGHAMGLAASDTWLALGFCTLIPFMTSATSTGILRAIDRFDLIALQQMVKPALQAAGSVVAWYFELGFAGFLITWYLTGLVGNLLLWGGAIYELRRQDIKGALRPRLFSAARSIETSWNFVWTTNLAHSVYSLRNAGSNVIVGVVLGPAAAGLFKIATSFFSAAGMPSELLEKSFYPEIMRLDPSSKRPWTLAIRSGALSFGLGLIMIVLVELFGKSLILLVFGERYVEAFELLQIMLWAVVISMAAFPLESLLYMAHRQRDALIAEGLGAICYIVLLVLCMQNFGVVGAAWAFFAGQCINALFFLIPVVRAYRHRHSLVHE